MEGFMENKKIDKKSPKSKFREVVGEAYPDRLGVWCPMCKDYIVLPNEEVDSPTIEVMVFDHYEAFHTAEEIEKFMGDSNV